MPKPGRETPNKRSGEEPQQARRKQSSSTAMYPKQSEPTASPAASEDGFETLYLSSRGAESGGGASSSAASRSLALGDVGGEAAEGQEHQTKVPTKALTLDDIVVPQDISLDASSMPKVR